MTREEMIDRPLNEEELISGIKNTRQVKLGLIMPVEDFWRLIYDLQQRIASLESSFISARTTAINECLDIAENVDVYDMKADETARAIRRLLG